MNPGLRPGRGVANFVYCGIEEPLDADTVGEASARQGLFLRALPAESTLRGRTIRVASKDAETQQRMLRKLADAVEDASGSRTAVRSG